MLNAAQGECLCCLESQAQGARGRQQLFFLIHFASTQSRRHKMKSRTQAAEKVLHLDQPGQAVDLLRLFSISVEE